MFITKKEHNRRMEAARDVARIEAANEYYTGNEDGERRGKLMAIRTLLKSNTIIFSDKTGYGACNKVPVNVDCVESVERVMREVGL